MPKPRVVTTQQVQLAITITNTSINAAAQLGGLAVRIYESARALNDTELTKDAQSLVQVANQYLAVADTARDLYKEALS